MQDLSFSEQVARYSALLKTQFNTVEDDIKLAHLYAIGAKYCKYCGRLEDVKRLQKYGHCRDCEDERLAITEDHIRQDLEEVE